MVKIDKNLVFLFSENSRFKIKDSSMVLKKSSQRLKYSISMLFKEEILFKPHLVVDYSYFGLILFRVYFKGGYIGEKDKKSILKLLDMNPYIVSIFELTGEFDLAIEFLSPNPSRFDKELKKLINLISTLSNYKVTLNLVTYIFPRFYLVKNKNLINYSKSEILIGGARVPLTLSDKQKAVLKSLKGEPTARYTRLAKLTSFTTKTIFSTYNSLLDMGIIKGVRSLIARDKLGIFRFRLFLRLHNLNLERESVLIDYSLKTEEIIHLNKTVGDWDLEIDIESMDKFRIRLIIVELREQFKDIIESFNSIEFYKDYKREYLPDYFL